jgi:hypothetical protein
MQRLLRWTLPVVLLAGICSADPISYYAALSGFNENPANASPGTGLTTVTYDAALHTLAVEVVFQSLTGATTASHIHCCVVPPGNVGVATQLPTFAGFPLGVTAGTYVNVFDLTLASSFNPAFVAANGGTAAGAEAALAAGLAAGQAYLNIHTTAFPGGEIRGFLQPVPEPATITLLGSSLALAFAKRRRRLRR